MLNQLCSLRRKINEALAVGEADISWDKKYDVLFEHYDKYLRFAVKDVGLTLFWVDPDTSYEEDAGAYLNALLDLADTVDALISAIEEAKE